VKKLNRYKQTAIEAHVNTLKKMVHMKGCTTWWDCPKQCGCDVPDDDLDINTALIWELSEKIWNFTDENWFQYHNDDIDEFKSLIPPTKRAAFIKTCSKQFTNLYCSQSCESAVRTWLECVYESITNSIQNLNEFRTLSAQFTTYLNLLGYHNDKYSRVYKICLIWRDRFRNAVYVSEATAKQMLKIYDDCEKWAISQKADVEGIRGEENFIYGSK
jgi:hypothetical protein